MTDDIFATDQNTLGDDDLTTDGLDPLDLEDEEDPDAVDEDSYDDNDDF